MGRNGGRREGRGLGGKQWANQRPIGLGVGDLAGNGSEAGQRTER